MSLSREQKKDLLRLSEYFRQIEKLALANGIDLDVYMTEYRLDGFQVYSTERIARNPNAENRKSVFEKDAKEKESSGRIN